jgi:3-hydroxypropanoate dehydrogenase
MTPRLDESALDQLFRSARSRNKWMPERLPSTVWEELYELVKLGPTSANTSPARFVFVTSTEAKERLGRHMSSTNCAKSMGAPAIVIIGYDLAFPERMPELFPHNLSARDWYKDEVFARETALRNASLQGAYLILAARALGIDAGPMSGFNPAGVDAEFFAGTTIRSNFLCALGHGADQPFPRLPRLPFREACRII